MTNRTGHLLAVSCVVLSLCAPGGARGEDGAGPPGKDILRQAFPTADRFGAIAGEPPAAPAYQGDVLAGYVFSSRQVVNSTGYSAKPLDVMVGLGLDGIITGVAIADHHEPILMIGVSGSDLDAFAAQYRGLDIRHPVRLDEVRPNGPAVIGISGATISSLVINDAVLRSARAVAASRGLFGAVASGLDFSSFAPATWPDLLAEGSLAHLSVAVGDAKAALARVGGRLFAAGVPAPPDEATYFELYAGLATPAHIGRNLLGERRHGALMAERGSADQLIFVAGSGLYSFKGHTYRRAGVFDRLQLVQGAETIRFRAADHVGLESVAIADAPDLREVAVFTVGPDTEFDPAKPWRLEVLVQAAGSGDDAPAVVFGLAYRLPDRFLAAEDSVDGPAGDTPLWRGVWRQKSGRIAILAAGLIVLTLIFVFQDALVRNRRVHAAVRMSFLAFTLLWIGWYAGAQLSVLNVLTFLDAVMTDFRWDFFLLEPLIFILWGYVAVALLFLGRGVFCGWLCPFGALQEFMARLGRLLRLPEWRLPFALSERLWPIKYVAFIALFAVFLHDPALAIRGAELEPFKTAIVLKFDRAWPFVLYAAALLVASMFVNRAFCRYLCPLGAALALPARIRMFEWLKRRWQCGKSCHICAATCPVQAIHPEGKINPNECIHCLTCQVNYRDDMLCPPLADRRRRRERALEMGSSGDVEKSAESTAASR